MMHPRRFRDENKPKHVDMMKAKKKKEKQTKFFLMLVYDTLIGEVSRCFFYLFQTAELSTKVWGR